MALLLDADHEGGDLSEWTGTSGKVSASADAALAGTDYGILVDIDDTTIDYCSKTTSYDTSGIWRARFYYNGDDVTFGSYNSFTIFRLYNGSFANLFDINLQDDAGTRKLRMIWRDESGVHADASYTVSAGDHYVEALYKQGNGDGEFKTWIDGVQKTNRTSLNNDNVSTYNGVYLCRVGDVTAPPSGTSGDLYIDEVIVNNTGDEIGPVTHALTSQTITSGVPTVAEPSIGQVHALTSQSVVAGVPTVAKPTVEDVSTDDNLTSQTVTAGVPTVAKPTIAQTHALSSQGVTAGIPTVAEPTAAAIATYYVDATGGDDDNGGLATDDAWQTITKVNAVTLNPDDQVLFKRGETFAGKLQPTDSGTSGHPIVFDAYGTGADPIIDGSGETMALDIPLSGSPASFLEFKNLHFSGGSGAVCRIYTHDVLMEDCKAEGGTEYGIASSATTADYIYNNTFRRCEVYDNGKSGIVIGSDDPGYPYNMMVEYCTVHDNGTSESADHGLYVDADVIVRECTVYDNKSAGIKCNSEFGYDSDYVPKIYNNEVYGNKIGINVAHHGMIAYNNVVYANTNYSLYWNAGVYDCVIVFNTLCNAINYSSSRGVYWNPTLNYDNVFKNNLIVQDTNVVYRECMGIGGSGPSYLDDVADSNDIDYNVYYQTGSDASDMFIDASGGSNCNWTEWKALTDSPDANGDNLNSLPGFVARYTDLHPAAGANFVGLGVAIEGYEYDKDGVERPDPPTPGAYEESDTHSLTSQTVSSGVPTVAKPSIGQTHALADQDVTSGTPTVAKATLGQEHALTDQDVTSGVPTVEKPTLGQVHGLTSQDVASGVPTVATPSVGQEQGLSSQDAIAGVPTVEQPSLGQTHILTDQDVIAGVPTVAKPTLGQEQSLTDQDVTSGVPTVSKPTLGQVHILTDQDVTVGIPTVGKPTLGQIHVLTSQTITSGIPTVAKATARHIILTSTPDSRTIRIPAENRTKIIKAETRVINIESEDRTITMK